MFLFFIPEDFPYRRERWESVETAVSVETEILDRNGFKPEAGRLAVLR